jgi:hypothetical protein
MEIEKLVERGRESKIPGVGSDMVGKHTSVLWRFRSTWREIVSSGEGRVILPVMGEEK